MVLVFGRQACICVRERIRTDRRTGPTWAEGNGKGKGKGRRGGEQRAAIIVGGSLANEAEKTGRFCLLITM